MATSVKALRYDHDKRSVAPIFALAQTPGEKCDLMTDFIRDARAGGCAVGTPPANLGFRLVRDGASRWEWLRSLVRL